MQPELRPTEVYKKLVHRTKYVGRFVWVIKLAILLSFVNFFFSLWFDHLWTSLVSLFVLVTTLLVLVQHHQHKLILKLVPDPGEFEGHDA